MTKDGRPSFDPGKPFTTRDGCEIGKFEQTKRGYRGVVGFTRLAWKRDGSYRGDGQKSGLDLINTLTGPTTPLWNRGDDGSTRGYYNEPHFPWM